MTDKPTLRRLMRSRLASLSHEERALSSEKIREGLKSLLATPSPSSPPSREGKTNSLPPWGGGVGRGGILGFLALPGEPHLVPFYRELQASGILVAVPKLADNRIVPVELPSDPAQLRPGLYGILEPTQPKIVPLSSLSLVLCPGLAFSPLGARLGRGGGHFDRFLAESRLPAWGVGFSTQMLEEIPTESWDQRMVKIITEEGTLSLPSP